MRTQFLQILKAAVTTVAFLFSAAVFGAPKQTSTPQVVHRAQDLAIHHRRTEAIKLLTDALASPSIKSSERESLREALADLAERFITDKGQRSFELGQSLLPAQPAQALHHFGEAAKVEDGNLQVSIAIVRAQLISEDCRGAIATLAPLAPLRMASTVMQELELEAYWCREDQAKVEEISKLTGFEQRLSNANLKVAGAWLKWVAGDSVKAAVQLREALTMDTQNAGALYWLWKIEKDSDKEGEIGQAAAEAYLKRCRGRDTDIRRRQGSLIEMCLKISEVENFLKAKAAESGSG